MPAEAGPTALAERLTALAKITGAPSPVVSVYLNTRWGDEHQRDRVRLFLKTELRKARQAATGAAALADLDWIEAQGESLVSQTRLPDAHGVALFACHALGLRETIPVRVPFEDTFVAADTPYLSPLAAALEETPSALVVFVDRESARLVPLTPEGAGEETRLQSDVPGQHRRGGWALLAQGRYQRHIQAHRGQHFEAVAEGILHLVEAQKLQWLVLAGEPGTLAVFRTHLPRRIGERIAGSIPAARHESASLLVARAAELLARRDTEEERAALDVALGEAARSGRAVAGLEETLEAVTRGAVHRLYLLKGLREQGRVCLECRALQAGSAPTCRLCGKATKPVELSEAMVDRVVAAGGTVDAVEDHQGLARVGGVAARLRYPL